MNNFTLICRSTLIVVVVAAVAAGLRVLAQETQPVGKTTADQKRNAVLLKGYDYSKYPSAITGYTGKTQNLTPAQGE